ncbi:MAG TPA: DUF790 family protein [Ktedonobacteraceae bacterium]|nr:DUF790 family protein [Ktedonobacteraceae bacterium]
MRFSLQEIKKSIHRHGSNLSLALHFLQPGELSTEIAQLISYHERLLGHPQRQFSAEDACACIGDYRLAHCLIATLSNWYSWQQREWMAATQEHMPENTPTSSAQLRLALYTYVNEHYHGFLDTHTRSFALQQFSEIYHLSLSDLEYLLVLDSEEEAILVRNTPEPPDPQQVATLYNQWAFEAALFNASSVHFVIDYTAFSNAPSPAETGFIPSAPTINTGIGSVIKRLCYLARKLGVYYDLTYEESNPIGEAHLNSNNDFFKGFDTLFPKAVPTYLHLTLYGPQEVTGTPQQYGIRLARLCRLLLDYSAPKTETGRKKGKRTGFTSAIREAEATVHFLQRTYTFVMDASMLQLMIPLERGEVSSQGASLTELSSNDASPLFDSSIEASFAEAFRALANSQGVDGWRLEREPEPLLLDQSIFIPDFALTRAQRRVYVEILGFWTPAYRERKIQKLQQLQGRNDLLLAIPIEAKDAFASIAPHFPTVIYDGQLSATEILQTLRSHYDDFTERLATLDIAEVRTLVVRKGLLPERACYEVLHCYRRSELQRAAERVVNEEVAFVPGLGLYQIAGIEQLKHSFLTWMSAARSLPLREVMSEMRTRWSMLTECEDATLEALLGLWPEVQVQRSSIFDAVVELVSDVETSPIDSASLPIVETQLIAPPKEMKKQIREKRVTLKKRSVDEAKQEDLWA